MEGRKDPFDPFGHARNVSISELHMTLECSDTKLWPHFFSCGCITKGPKENLCQQVRASLCAIYFELLKLPSQCMAAMRERERSTLSTKHTQNA
jgi:hypothetical protein